MPRMTQAELNAYEARMTAKAVLESLPSGCSDESGLHAQIFNECRRRGWIALHGSMAERTHRTLGEPDFTIMADRGRVFFIEAKTRTGKLSPAQLAMKGHAEKLGHTISVVRSFEQFLQIAP